MKSRKDFDESKKQKSTQPFEEVVLYPIHGMSLDEGQTFIQMSTLEELAKKEEKIQ